MRSERRIYLASRSPHRRELLKQIGISFEPLLMRQDMRRGVDVDKGLMPGESPVAFAERIAILKAETGWAQVAKRGFMLMPVLAANTLVVIDGEIIGKPTDERLAHEVLRRLSGRTHEVLTAVALARTDQVEVVLSRCEVEFGEISDDEIGRYIAAREGFGRAGAYAIHGRAGVFVRAIRGTYSGIMGLPLFETAELLRRFDIASI
jgi:septum formation protein